MNIKAITFLCGLAALVSPGYSHAAVISEPATVFYGRILGVDGARPFLVTEGGLEWTFQRHDGTELVLRTLLEPLNDGEFSYRLDVPHTALALELRPPVPSIPLGGGVETITHSRIEVQGLPARIVGPNGGSFDVGQAYRAATYRLDLEVDLAPEDSDGDGLPDWWEDEFGLDKLDPSDADGDLDGDGLSALLEYQNDSDPNQDTRRPRLVTESLVAYKNGTTGVLLAAEDSDSSADQLVYTINGLPAGGELYLRNVWEDPSAPDRMLEAGDSFTQRDIQEGRLVLKHQSGSATTTLVLALNDEDPEHEAFEGEVEVQFYAPDPALLEGVSEEELLAVAYGAGTLAGVSTSERPLLQNFLQSQLAGHIIWDGSRSRQPLPLSAPSADIAEAVYKARFGSDFPHTLLGGAGQDELAGGHSGDLLVGGAGNDRLQGNAGSDRFVFAAPNAGDDVVVDFNPDHHDVLDIAGLMDGVSLFFSDYVSLENESSGARLWIDSDGDGSEYSDASVLLMGWTLTEDDLREWVDAGNLVTGGLKLIPVVTLAVTSPLASENGPVNGELVLMRSGPDDEDLAVQISIAGSASNGVDYSTLDAVVVIPAGQNQRIISVRPYADALIETLETVEVIVLSGQGYEVGGSKQAVVEIEDLAPQLSLEVLDPVAERSTGKSATLLVRRGGVIDRSVLVRLAVGGTAVNGVDYESIPAFLNLLPGQTTALIEVKPRLTSQNQGMNQSVNISLLEDESYKRSAGTVGCLWIAEQGESFAQWRSLHAAGSSGALQEFAQAKPAGSSLTYLQLYAFGINPDDAGHRVQGIPAYRIVDNHLVVSFKRPANVVGVDYKVEVSGDLTTWQSGKGHVEEWLPGTVEAGAESLSYRAASAVNEDQILYMRVKLSLQP